MRDVNPLKLQSFLSDECKQKVEESITVSKTGLSLKAKKNEELNQLSEIKKVQKFSSEISFHQFFNQTKGIIYIRNDELSELIWKKILKIRTFIHRKRNWSEFCKVKEL